MTTSLPSKKKRQSISVSLPPKLVSQIERKLKRGQSRSSFIEAVLCEHFTRLAREKIHLRDIKLINANIDVLNRQAADTLHDQAPIHFFSEGE